MSTDTTPSPEATRTEQSRRRLLAAGLAAAAAAAAATVARVIPVAGADGDTVTVGSTHSGSSTTTFQTSDVNAVDATSDSARGVSGTSTSGQGIHGTSSSSAGVAGVSDSGNGVHGTSTSSRGVYGVSTSGTGVEGSGAVGVKAESQNGYALETTAGRVRFAGISGIATIPAGDTTVTLTPGIPISDSTLVFLTAENNLDDRALWFTKQESNGQVIVHISRQRSNPTKVSYLLLEHA